MHLDYVCIISHFMSFQSVGPEVYQYAPQSYSSNISPFLIKQPTNSIDSHPAPHPANFNPTYSPPQYTSKITLAPNNYQQSPSLSPPNFASLGYKASQNPSQESMNAKPSIVVDNKLLEAQVAENHKPAEHPSDRYENYLEHEAEEYKYNIFSFADEPWNRCLNGDGCGRLPGNECIARANPRKYWD